MWEKTKETAKCEKNTITCDVETAQCKNRQMWEKSKGTTKCEKRTITCDIGTTQCEKKTIEWEKKVRERLNVRMEPSNVRKK